MRFLPLLLLAVPSIALAQTTAPAPAPTPDAAKGKATDPSQKIICKSFSTVGSLIASHKECKTKADWDRERAQLRMNNPTGSCPGGGGPGGGTC